MNYIWVIQLELIVHIWVSKIGAKAGHDLLFLMLKGKEPWAMGEGQPPGDSEHLKRSQLSFPSFLENIAWCQRGTYVNHPREAPSSAPCQKRRKKIRIAVNPHNKNGLFMVVNCQQEVRSLWTIYACPMCFPQAQAGSCIQWEGERETLEGQREGGVLLSKRKTAVEEEEEELWKRRRLWKRRMMMWIWEDTGGRGRSCYEGGWRPAY